VTTSLKAILAAARRASGQKSESTRSLYLAIADSTATLMTVAVAALISNLTQPIVGYASVPFGLVLLSSFRLVALRAAERARRERLDQDDIVSQDHQIDEDYESDLARIDRLSVAPPDKERLRLEAFDDQKRRRQELRPAQSRRPASSLKKHRPEITASSEIGMSDPPRSSGIAPRDFNSTTGQSART
jgi:hypothetical protein